MECVLSSCQEGEVCRKSGGVPGCQPSGSASCQSTGHQHYQTFDGHSFKLPPGCASVLAKVVKESVGVSQFTIIVGDASGKARHKNNTLTQSLTVEVNRQRVTMRHGVSDKVQ
eukprot:g16580.t1